MRKAIAVVTVLCVAAGPVLAGCSTRATGLGWVALKAPTDTGIALLEADYGIEAGRPPHTVTVRRVGGVPR